MPQADQPAAGFGFMLEGCYATLLRKIVELEEGPDYRYALHWPHKRWMKLKGDCEAVVERVFAERLAAGKPFEVDAFWIGGHSVPMPVSGAAPKWLLDPSVRRIQVSANDSLLPVYGDDSRPTFDFGTG